jgi:hypothetical protein
MKCLKPALLAAIGAAAVFAMLASTTPASAGTVARSAPASTGAVVDWQNQFNQLCLDGREGTGNVTLQGCTLDGSHENWVNIDPSTSGSEMQNIFNGLCLDGREGTGNVTLQRCGTDGTHEVWTARTVGSPSVAELKDVFNGLCLDGREGTGNVTLQPCGFPGPVPDGTHEYWTPLD